MSELSVLLKLYGTVLPPDFLNLVEWARDEWKRIRVSKWCMYMVALRTPRMRPQTFITRYQNKIFAISFWILQIKSVSVKSKRLVQQSLEKTTFLEHSDYKFQACIKQNHPLTKYHITQDGACTGFCLLTLCTETWTEQNPKLWQAISKWPYLEAVSKIPKRVKWHHHA